MSKKVVEVLFSGRWIRLDPDWFPEGASSLNGWWGSQTEHGQFIRVNLDLAEAIIYPPKKKSTPSKEKK